MLPLFILKQTIYRKNTKTFQLKAFTIKKHTAQLLILGNAIILGSTLIAVPNRRRPPKRHTLSQDALLRNGLAPHNPEPVAAAHIQRQEIAPENYTGITRITDRLGDLIQHVGLPIATAYHTSDPKLTLASMFIFNTYLFIPIGKKILRWPHCRLPLRHNLLHKDREIYDWLYQATKNACAHSYNQTAKVATSFIVPRLTKAFIIQACPALIGKY